MRLPGRFPILFVALPIALTACGSTDASEPTPATTTAAAPVEQGAATPRLALSYDGGVLVVDAASLEPVADIPVDGFIRLNSADDGRHVFVSESSGFRVLDLGTWTRGHGDHGHYYTATPQLTDTRFGGSEPGHVVPHDERITLFSDGTGQVDVVKPADLARGDTNAASFTVPQPHHGVAVYRADGTVVVSVGDEQTRNGIAILDANQTEIASTTACPGVHGEAAAVGGALTFGCEDGILVVRGNDIRKIASPDSYGRIGNQAGHDDSPIVLGDYKTDAEAELERPNRFSLTDTSTGTVRIIPFPASYSFRSLERGPRGEAVILGTDGALYVYDPIGGNQIARHPVIDAWTEPDEWQSPMPNVHVQDGVAYVADPVARTLTAVDLGTGEQRTKKDMPHTTIELTGVSG
ncbi:zinc metallochaperone AztD [Aldersonia kunmingensis]|uniref:zinc metallochaperone AztD n=1 Tax=Aldersonia kunmingensis TaxID=408066 RepID=UPI00082C7549|nr:zinc metallochaperone AztD [Aldersonia kunmingensis]